MMKVGGVYKVKMVDTSFVGVCLARKKSQNVLLRNNVGGEGVELLLNLRNPKLVRIELLKGFLIKKVRNKLYHLRLKRQSKMKIKF